jgi:hypothetical protein
MKTKIKILNVYPKKDTFLVVYKVNGNHMVKTITLRDGDWYDPNLEFISNNLKTLLRDVYDFEKAWEENKYDEIPF